MQQRFTDTGVPHHFMAKVSRDSFCADTPQNDSFMGVENTASNRQIFEKTAPDFGVVERGHDFGGDSTRMALIGKNSQNFK